jgi:hypothetical protein
MMHALTDKNVCTSAKGGSAKGRGFYAPTLFVPDKESSSRDHTEEATRPLEHKLS